MARTFLAAETVAPEDERMCCHGDASALRILERGRQLRPLLRAPAEIRTCYMRKQRSC